MKDELSKRFGIKSPCIDCKENGDDSENPCLERCQLARSWAIKIGDLLTNKKKLKKRW